MLNLIDNILNRITMYRLMLYYLSVLVGAAVVLSFFQILPYSSLAIVFSTFILVVVSVITNKVFALVFKAPTNIESAYISALILVLIITPTMSFSNIMFFIWAAILAMASKYILALGNKHIFNPVAVAVVITAFAINQSASWWVGNQAMMPLVLLGGLLILRKTQRDDLVFSFFFATAAVILADIIIKGSNLFSLLNTSLFHSPLLFFAFIMLTEPLTTPPTNNLQIIYGALVGFLFSPQFHIGSLYLAPEQALILGNIFSYLVSPKEKLMLQLKEKIKTATDTFDYVFPLQKKLAFVPGQYMEWTLSHPQTDSRGNRRYFTLASSPTEATLRIGVKFYNPGSSYKKSLLALTDQTTIVAAQRAGDFTLPKNQDQKMVFIAGGIGITPYRSMIKYLIDKQERRNIVLFYSNKNAPEIVYKDIFDQAERELGIKTVYTLTDTSNLPSGWSGKIGRIDGRMIQETVPDYLERLFYISGPNSLVTKFKETLKTLGIAEDKIKTDFFPGFV